MLSDDEYSAGKKNDINVFVIQKSSEPTLVLRAGSLRDLTRNNKYHYLLFGIRGESRSMQVVRVQAGRARVPVSRRARTQRLRVVQTHIHRIAHL